MRRKDIHKTAWAAGLLFLTLFLGWAGFTPVHAETGFSAIYVSMKEAPAVCPGYYKEDNCAVCLRIPIAEEAENWSARFSLACEGQSELLVDVNAFSCTCWLDCVSYPAESILIERPEDRNEISVEIPASLITDLGDGRICLQASGHDGFGGTFAAEEDPFQPGRFLEADEEPEDGQISFVLDTISPVFSESAPVGIPYHSEYYLSDRIFDYEIHIADANFDPALIHLQKGRYDDAYGDFTRAVISDFDVEIPVNPDGSVVSSIDTEGIFRFRLSGCDMAGNALVQEGKPGKGYPDSHPHLSVQQLVDLTPPEIVVTYDNNAASNGTYFSDSRMAAVFVQERNISPYMLEIETNGAVGPWTQTEGGSAWTCRLDYVQEDRCRLEVSGRDAVGHEAEVHYNGTAPTDFVIDRTAPKLQVNYEKAEAKNKIFYNEPLKAVITVDDLNYSPEGLVIEAYDTEAPVYVSERSGTIRSYVMECAEEGIYHFRIECRDLAGNCSEVMEVPEFVIDLTPPLLEVEGITENGIYGRNSSVLPLVKISDRNRNAAMENVVLEGAENGVLDLSEETDGETGIRQVKINAFPDAPTSDGRYTLLVYAEDLAGNFSKLTRKFTVDRYGSVFDYGNDAGTSDLVERYYTDVAGDFVIREMNPCELDAGSIRVSVTNNGTVKTLSPGEGLKITEKAGPERFVYQYTVSSGELKEEGAYRIVTYSSDAAGNTNSCTVFVRQDGHVTGLNTDFYVDHTPPEVEIDPELHRHIFADEQPVNIYFRDNVFPARVEIYVDGELKTCLEGSELENYRNGLYTFEAHAKEGEQTLRIVVTDEAGLTSEAEKTFLLSSDPAGHTIGDPLVIGIAGVFAVLLLLIWIILCRRRKKESAL